MNHGRGVVLKKVGKKRRIQICSSYSSREIRTEVPADEKELRKETSKSRYSQNYSESMEFESIGRMFDMSKDLGIPKGSLDLKMILKMCEDPRNSGGSSKQRMRGSSWLNDDVYSEDVSRKLNTGRKMWLRRYLKRSKSVTVKLSYISKSYSFQYITRIE